MDSDKFKRKVKLIPLKITTDNGTEEINVQDVTRIVFKNNKICIFTETKKTIIYKENLNWSHWDGLRRDLRGLYEGIEE